jgi:hypothetical protein
MPKRLPARDVGVKPDQVLTALNAWGMAAVPLIYRIAGTGRRAQLCSMRNDTNPATEVICPVCGQTMTYLHRIWRAFNGDRDVFRCGSCKVSMTRAVKMAPAA